MTTFLIFIVTLLIVAFWTLFGLVTMAIGRSGNIQYGIGFLWGAALGPIGVGFVGFHVLKVRRSLRKVSEGLP